MASFTKFAILKVFGDLAASRPVDKITVKDITDQCGISRNTFYYHYQDIYQVLKAYVQYSAEHVIELMVEDEGEDGKAGLREIRYLEANRELLCNLYRSAANEEVRNCLQSASQIIFDRLIESVSQGMEVHTQCGVPVYGSGDHDQLDGRGWNAERGNTGAGFGPPGLFV